MRCPWCDEVIKPKEGHLHHWLIKRGDKPKSAFERIDVPENLMLLHMECHMEHGQTITMRDRCLTTAKAVLGEDRLLRWYNALEDIGVQPVDSADELYTYKKER